MALDLKKLSVRLAPTVVFVPLFIYLILKLSVYWFMGFSFIVLILGAKELANFAEKLSARYYTTPSLLIIGAMIVNSVTNTIVLSDLMTAGFVLILLWGFFVYSDTEKYKSSAAYTFLGTFYLGIPLVYQMQIKQLDNGSAFLITLYFLIWLGDSAAYFFGSIFGKHKLAPSISPKKTIEGAVFNIIFNIIGVYLGNYLFIKSLSITHIVIIGLTAGLAGLVGDLIESLWKRCAGIKDSANLIPGHGGILDRLDSLVLSSPVLYFYIKYVLIS